MKIIHVTSLLITSLFSSAIFANTNCCCQWTGFYAGINVGAVNHIMDLTDTTATSFLATLHQVSDPSLTGGLQLGYRRQVDFAQASGVYGLEASTHFSNATFDKNYGSPFATYQLNSQNQLKNVSLLEAIGGIAVSNTLLFLGAGISWVNITGKTENLDSIAFFDSFNVNKRIFGTALGGGIEYIFCNTVSVRFKVDVITPNTYTVKNNVGNSFEISNNIVQSTIGINYKFA